MPIRPCMMRVCHRDALCHVAIGNTLPTSPCETQHAMDVSRIQHGNSDPWRSVAQALSAYQDSDWMWVLSWHLSLKIRKVVQRGKSSRLGCPLAGPGLYNKFFLRRRIKQRSDDIGVSINMKRKLNTAPDKDLYSKHY